MFENVTETKLCTDVHKLLENHTYFGKYLVSHKFYYFVDAFYTKLGSKVE